MGEIKQGPKELIKGWEFNGGEFDFGRSSIYEGDYHMHLGHDTPTMTKIKGKSSLEFFSPIKIKNEE